MVFFFFFFFLFFFFFFFQAEDGIRDTSVTGVQTCALPISSEDTVLVTLASTFAPVKLNVASVAALVVTMPVIDRKSVV